MNPEPKEEEEGEEVSIAELPEFDMKLIEADSFISFVGPRRSGKTWAMHSLCYHRMRELWPVVRVMSKTIHSNEWPQIHDEFKSGWDESILSSMLAMQKTRLRIHLEILQKEGILDRFSHEKEIDEYYDLHHGFILEDCASEHQLLTNKDLYSLAMEGRHLKFGVFVSTQHVKAIATRMRHNSDYVFIFPFKDFDSREAVVLNYLGQLEKPVALRFLDDFFRGKQEVEHKAMVVRITSAFESPLDGIYQFHAPPFPWKFLMGDPEEVWGEAKKE